MKVAESLRPIGSAIDLPGGDLQRGDDGHGAVADVFELPPCGQAGSGGALGEFTAFGLDSGFFIAMQNRAGSPRGGPPCAGTRSHTAGACARTLGVAAVQPAPDPVRRQFQAGQDPPHLGG